MAWPLSVGASFNSHPARLNAHHHSTFPRASPPHNAPMAPHPPPPPQPPDIRTRPILNTPQAMMMDRRLNPMQHSEGALKQLIESFQYWKSGSGVDFRVPVKGLW